MPIDIKKDNSDFDLTGQLKKYIGSSEWVDRYPKLWEVLDKSAGDFSQQIYEKIANFIPNICDIDTCGISQLKSIASMLGTDSDSISNIVYPLPLKDIMDILTINPVHIVNNEVIDSDTPGTQLHVYNIVNEYFISPLTYKNDFDNINSYGVYDSDGNFNPIDEPTNVLYIKLSSYIDNFIESYIKEHISTNLSEGALVEEYKAFIERIYPYTNINWDDTDEISTTSAHILRNICMQVMYQRESLKYMAQRHNKIGTSSAIKDIITEYILRNFTKREDWNIFVPTDNVLPELQDRSDLEQALPSLNDFTSSTFNVDVVEYYDSTEYFNIDNNEDVPSLQGVTGATVEDVKRGTILDDGTIQSFTEQVYSPLIDSLDTVISSGGSECYWKKDKDTLVAISDQNEQDIISYYNKLGGNNVLEGAVDNSYTYDEIHAFQAKLWDTFSSHGYVDGELSEIYRKYIGNYSYKSIDYTFDTTNGSYENIISDSMLKGTNVAGNIKNTNNPTIATTPFIWNLTEAANSSEYELLDTRIITDDIELSIAQNDIDDGCLRNSWKYFNQELTGYQTNFEYSKNIDIHGNESAGIDRDGPFIPLALENLVDGYTIDYIIDTYYSNIGISATVKQYIKEQLVAYKDDIYTNSNVVGVSLKNKRIYNYSVDFSDNNYMLYKNIDSVAITGDIWVRLRNHALPLPLYETLNSDNSILLNAVNNCYEMSVTNNKMYMFSNTENNDGYGKLVTYNMISIPNNGKLDIISDNNLVVKELTPEMRREDYIGCFIYNGYVYILYYLLDDIILARYNINDDTFMPTVTISTNTTSSGIAGFTVSSDTISIVFNTGDSKIQVENISLLNLALIDTYNVASIGNGDDIYKCVKGKDYLICTGQTTNGNAVTNNYFCINSQAMYDYNSFSGIQLKTPASDLDNTSTKLPYVNINDMVQVNDKYYTLTELTDQCIKHTTQQLNEVIGYHTTDERRTLLSLAERNNIPLDIRYDGMQVYVLDDIDGNTGTLYVLNNGYTVNDLSDNSNWMELSTTRTRVNSIVDRNNIIYANRYNNMQVYVVENDTLYKLVYSGSIAYKLNNSNWIPVDDSTQYVDTVSDRNSIPLEERTRDMQVYVNEDDTIYSLSKPYTMSDKLDNNENFQPYPINRYTIDSSVDLWGLDNVITAGLTRTALVYVENIDQYYTNMGLDSGNLTKWQVVESFNTFDDMTNTYFTRSAEMLIYIIDTDTVFQLIPNYRSSSLLENSKWVDTNDDLRIVKPVYKRGDVIYSQSPEWEDEQLYVSYYKPFEDASGDTLVDGGSVDSSDDIWVDDNGNGYDSYIYKISKYQLPSMQTANSLKTNYLYEDDVSSEMLYNNHLTANPFKLKNFYTYEWDTEIDKVNSVLTCLRTYNKVGFDGNQLWLAYNLDGNVHQKKDEINGIDEETSINNYDLVERVYGLYKLRNSRLHKSNLFSIRINDSGLNTSFSGSNELKLEVQSIIEEAVRKRINKIKPAHTELFKIEWTGK
jgi:hypothetical protein